MKFEFKSTDRQPNTPGKNKQENLICKLTVSTFENTQTLVPHNMQNTFMRHFILENMYHLVNNHV